MRVFRIALILPLALLPMAQVWAQRGETPQAPPVSIKELVLVDYTPRAIKSSDAMRLIEELFGSQILVSEKNDRGSQRVDHFIRVGNTILIRDTREQAMKILSEIENLEKVLGESAQDDSKQPGGLVSAEYVPRALSAEALFEALEGYRRALSSKTIGDKIVEKQENVHLFREGQSILIQDEKRRVDEILAFLARVDTPAQQATFTILVIAGRDTGPSSPGLPQELVQNLGQMVPVNSFELLSTAILHGSVRDKMELSSTSRDSVRYTVTLDPAAYSESAGRLTLRNCSVELETPTYSTNTDKIGRERTIHSYEEQSFSTSASLYEGEYTALGAIGSDPVFVVLRMTATK